MKSIKPVKQEANNEDVLARSVIYRFDRVVRLSEMGAPTWIIDGEKTQLKRVLDEYSLVRGKP
jgi:hypothetical protein